MTTAVIDWDAWRMAYPTMTYADHQAFYSEIYYQHPEQRHYSAAYAAKAIEQTTPRTIVELGGWDGELAQKMLSLYPGIEQWTNVEICREAAVSGIGRHPKYEAPDLPDWYWKNGPWSCDLLVASHTIEHLSVHHLTQAVAATHAKALFFDAPLYDHPTNWTGYTASHILETGWTGVSDICSRYGYHLDWAENHATNATSGEQARACLYLHEDHA